MSLAGNFVPPDKIVLIHLIMLSIDVIINQASLSMVYQQNVKYYL